jgi:hypothetical protein
MLWTPPWCLMVVPAEGNRGWLWGAQDVASRAFLFLVLVLVRDVGVCFRGPGRFALAVCVGCGERPKRTFSAWLARRRAERLARVWFSGLR